MQAKVPTPDEAHRIATNISRKITVRGPSSPPSDSAGHTLVDLHWDQIDLNHAVLHVRRVKQGTPSTHPLTGRELRAPRRLEREATIKSPFCVRQ